ncbi:MAG: hypothetical protein IPK46_21925 [Saprospiraceae bacterium]|nr:hypothetical protein [Saprospiraceae bacterium]
MSEEKKQRWPKGFTWQEKLVILILLAFVLLGPYLLTKTWCSNSAFGQEAAWVGDTIGGLTAPFLNLLAAWLVYRTLREQIEANKLISFDAQSRSLNDLVNSKILMLEQVFLSIRFGTLSGKEAILEQVAYFLNASEITKKH